MTWEELYEKAKGTKRCGCYFHNVISFRTRLKKSTDIKHITFSKNGEVTISIVEDDCVVVRNIGRKRTPDQMFAIMEALK